jgi:hypothetical protein
MRPWIWLDGYQLDADGDDLRSVYVRLARVRQVAYKRPAAAVDPVAAGSYRPPIDSWTGPASSASV